jgi:protein-tyrosine phosphatase
VSVAARVSEDQGRVLSLDGALNLRDFGGYPSSRGGEVRRQMLYRSGAMDRLSAEAETHLAGLGIALVWDLRRRTERDGAPTRWCAAAGIELVARDHEQTPGVLAALLRDNRLEPDAARAAMIELYRVLAEVHAPSFRDIFARLLAGQVPLLLHCTAGKDRTGVGAALILSALDVPRETIIADYALTAEVADFSDLLGHYAHLPTETIAPLFASEPVYIEAMFEALDARHGGVDRFLESELGVGEEERVRLRALLVQ